MNKWGYEEQVWDQALADGTKELTKRALRRGNQTISYSELAREIKSISFNADDFVFHELLGQISKTESKAGRGMLSVLVIHKDGDQMPGQGFFKVAEELGRKVENKEKFWIEEFNKVLDAHQGKGTGS